MIGTIVTSSLNTAQLFALVALIIFIIAAVVAFGVKTWWATLIAAGLAFTAASLLWGLTG